MAQDFRDIYEFFKGGQPIQMTDYYLHPKLSSVFQDFTSLKLILQVLKMARGDNINQKSPEQDIDCFSEYLENRANTSSTSFCFTDFKQVVSHLYQHEALEAELQISNRDLVEFAGFEEAQATDATELYLECVEIIKQLRRHLWTPLEIMVARFLLLSIRVSTLVALLNRTTLGTDAKDLAQSFLHLEHPIDHSPAFNEINAFQEAEPEAIPNPFLLALSDELAFVPSSPFSTSDDLLYYDNRGSADQHSYSDNYN